jgi:hypothetical protein
LAIIEDSPCSFSVDWVPVKLEFANYIAYQQKLQHLLVPINILLLLLFQKCDNVLQPARAEQLLLRPQRLTRNVARPN